MGRVIRILAYSFWVGTLISNIAFQLLKMEYTRTRPQSARESLGQVFPVSGFYNKTVFLREAEVKWLDSAYYCAYGSLGVSFVGMLAMNLLRRREKRRL